MQVSQILSQSKKHYPCTNISLSVVLYKTRHDQTNYFWNNYRHSIIDKFTLNQFIALCNLSAHMLFIISDLCRLCVISSNNS